LQIPVLIGRSFTERDGPDAQDVAIVNQTFARKFFHGANPVGHYVDKNIMIVGRIFPAHESRDLLLTICA